MKRNCIILLLLCSLVVSPTFAQRDLKVSYNHEHEPAFKPEYFAFGTRIGMGVNTLRGLNNRDIPGLINREVLPYTTNPIFQGSVEFTGQVMFYNQLLVQLDLGVTTLGVGVKDEEFSRNILGLQLHTRLLLGSKLGIGDIEGFNFLYGAGPFLGWIFGSGDGDLLDYEYEEDIDMSALDLKTLNYGLSAMLGLEYYGWQLGLYYNHGFRNMAYDGRMQTSGLLVGIGYVVGF